MTTFTIFYLKNCVPLSQPSMSFISLRLHTFPKPANQGKLEMCNIPSESLPPGQAQTVDNVQHLT